MCTYDPRLVKQQKGFFITVIGCIGCGKSVFTKNLGGVIQKNYGECRCFFEPAAKEDGEASVFLPLFYNDQKRWSFAVQIEMLTKRFSQHRLAQNMSFEGISSVADSMFWSDCVFVNLLEKQGNMTHDEANLYYKLFSEMRVGLVYPSAVIYLSVTPEISLKRINKRISEKEGRSMESGISIDYLQGLISEYDKLQMYLKNFCNVITLDWNDDKTEEQIYKEAEKIFEKIRNN